MSRKKYDIQLSESQEKIVNQIAKATSGRADLKQRSTIISLAHQGKGSTEICKELSICGECAWKWKKRFSEAGEKLAAIEKDEPGKLKDAIVEILSDQPRPGTPAKFTDEQFAQIISLSLKEPESVGVPISHWTPTELAKKSIEENIVDSISPTQIWRFLKRSRFKTSHEQGMVKSQY